MGSDTPQQTKTFLRPPIEGLADNVPKMSARSVAPKSFRGRIAAGVVLIIPLAVTALLIKYVYNAALWVGVRLVYWASLVFSIVTNFIRSTGATNTANEPWLPKTNTKWIDAANADGYDIGMAIVLTILMFYLLGWLGTNVVGKRLILLVESLLQRIPLVDTIYGSMKRMVAALGGSADGDQQEKKVVMIDFPSPEMRTIGFVTSYFSETASGRRYAAVYVPTTPNPTSGYMEVVPVDKITETDLTMEQALSMILSGGATAPPTLRMTPAPAPPTDDKTAPVPTARG